MLETMHYLYEAILFIGILGTFEYQHYAHF